MSGTFWKVLSMVAFAALPAIAQQEITRHDRLTNWSLFEDDGYCWIATNSRFFGNQRLLLTVDLEGSVAVFLDMEDGITFDDDADHVMTLDTREILFRSQGAWAWTKRESPERLLETILDSTEIGFDYHIIDHGNRRSLTGKWETDEGQQAFDTLRESCGS